MTSRGLSALLTRTGLALVIAVIVLTITGWSWLGGVAVGLIGAAALVQLIGVVWLRRKERAPQPSRR